MASRWLMVVRGVGSPRFPRRCVVTGSCEEPLALVPISVDDSTRAYATPERAELLIDAHRASRRCEGLGEWLGTTFFVGAIALMSSLPALRWGILIVGLMAWCCFTFLALRARKLTREAWNGPAMITGRRVVGRTYLIFGTEAHAREVAELNIDMPITIRPVGFLRSLLIVGAL